MIIQPDFQRGIVWSNKSQSIFIDSLIKQLPIPSLCISLDIKTNKRMVIDGLQRMSSIIRFLNDEEWKVTKTDSIDSRISGKKIALIREETPELIQIVENVVIPVTVIRCDYTNNYHMKYLYQIFQRLNSGGTKLLPQEIRNCIYQGKFNSKLKQIVRKPLWLELRNRNLTSIDNNRFLNEELLLRFYAFYYDISEYEGKLTDFLNNFMFKNKDLSDEQLVIYESLITDTIQLIMDKIDDKSKITKLRRNSLEGLLIGVAKNLENLKEIPNNTFNDMYNTFINLPEFSFEELSEGVAEKDKVNARIKSAIKAFAGK